jgi:ribosomal protein S18 acetylase RimI-like enzyme
VSWSDSSVSRSRRSCSAADPTPRASAGSIRGTPYAEMRVRAREQDDWAEVEAFLTRHNSWRVARGGVLEHVPSYPMLLAEEDGRLLGLLTYVPAPPRCEVLTLHVEEQWRGLGTALIEAATHRAAEAGCARLWVITTNDNVDALRFYQRRGFRLVALHAGAVDDSRARLKPEIPPLGEYGIPLRDEIELELEL